MESSSFTARLLQPLLTIREKLEKRKVKNEEKNEEKKRLEKAINNEKKQIKSKILRSCFLWCFGIGNSDLDDDDYYEKTPDEIIYGDDSTIEDRFSVIDDLEYDDWSDSYSFTWCIPMPIDEKSDDDHEDYYVSLSTYV